MFTNVWQHTARPVAHLGFPVPGDKVSLGTPIQSVRGRTDAKNELGVKGRRKLSRIYLFPGSSENFI